MRTVLSVLAVWCLISVPAALAMGAAVARGDRHLQRQIAQRSGAGTRPGPRLRLVAPRLGPAEAGKALAAVGSPGERAEAGPEVA